MDFEIPTYWNVEGLFYTFNGIAAFFGSGDFNGLMKMMLLIGVACGMFGYMSGRQIEFVKWFFSALILMTVLNLPVARVVISDKTSWQGPRTVENVPVMLAAIEELQARFADFSVRTTETIFSLPDDLKMGQNDLGFAHRMFKMTGQITVLDPELRADIMQFFKECTTYDIRDGALSADVIMKGVGSWDYIFDNTNPGRFVTTNTLSNPMLTDTCANVAKGGGSITNANSLSKRIDAAQVKAEKYYGQKLFPTAASDTIAAGLFTAAVPNAYDFILGASVSASDAIKQSMFNNLWRDAGGELPVLLNDPAAAQQAAAKSIAAAQINSSLRTQAIFAEDTIPRIRNYVEIMLVYLFPFLVAYVLALSAEEAKAAVKFYFMSFAWIALWPMLFAILNFAATLHLRTKAKADALAATGIPFQMQDYLNGVLVDEQAMLGYMVWLVPAISGAFIALARGPMSGMTDRLFSSMQGTSGQVGASAGAGNFNLGQSGLDTSSVNTTMANKIDTDASMKSGARHFRSSDGTEWSQMPSGQMVARKPTDSLGVSADMGRLSSSGASTTAGMQSTLDQREGVERASRNVATFVNATSHVDTQGKNQNYGKTTDTYQSGDQASSAGGSVSKGSSYAKDGAFVTDDRSQVGGHISGNVGANFKLGSEAKYQRGQNEALAKKTGLSDDEAGIVRAGRAQGLPENQIREMVERRHAANNQNSGKGFGLGAGVDNMRAFSASVTKAFRETQNFSNTEEARRLNNFVVGASERQSYLDGDASSQTNRNERSATLTSSTDVANTNGATMTDSRRIDNSVDRREQDSLTMSRNFLGDPHNVDAVARRYGMSPIQFRMQRPDQIENMTKNYLAERETSFFTMRPMDLENNAVVRSRDGLQDNYNGISDSLNGGVRQIHESNVGKTGAGPIGTVAPPKGFTENAHSRIEAKSDYTDNRLTGMANDKDVKPLVETVHYNSSISRPDGDANRSVDGAAKKMAAKNVASTFGFGEDKDPLPGEGNQGGKK